MPYISRQTSNAIAALLKSDDPDTTASCLQELRDIRTIYPYGERPDEVHAADEVANTFNIIGFDAAKFAAAMGTQHRTLQQTFTGVCLEWLLYLSRQEAYDARNEASVRTAKKIAAMCEEFDVYIGRLPLI